MGALWAHLGGQKTTWDTQSAPRAAQGPQPKNTLTHFETCLEPISSKNPDFAGKKRLLKSMCFLRSFLRHLGHCMAWAHMQSVRACAVETHFSIIYLFSKKAPKRPPLRLILATIFEQKVALGRTKEVQKTGTKKGALPS